MGIDVISKPVYQILSELTQEPRLEVALPLAVKDLVRLRLKEAVDQRTQFEERYVMTFSEFEQNWEQGQIPAPHSFAVEQDYWEWEAAVTDEMRLRELEATLP